MILLSGSLLLYTASVSKRVARNELYETLTSSVNSLYDQLRYKKPANEFNPSIRPDGNKKPPMDDNKQGSSMLEIPENATYKDGDVYMAIFDIQGSAEPIQYGELPAGVAFDEATSANNEKTLEAGENGEYYIFKRLIKDPGDKDNKAWVVGAIDAQLSASVGHGTLQLAAFSIPFVIIFAALLGYAITKRAFKPVADITATAAEISSSNDLSRRINPQGKVKDEIYDLAITFDGMLDTIQQNYEKEKQFTDDASHELRTPVAVIMAQCELAKTQGSNQNDLRDAIDSVHRQSLKMNKLLSELLMLARADNNRAVWEMESFDLVELAEMIIDEEYSISQSKNISITLEAEDSVEVYADRTAIMRVLINFINNAIKYGNDGGFVKISIERHGAKGAKCKVSDNGIGISKSDLDKIWNRFYRADSSRTDDGYGSTGLGLPIAKSIIEAMGGSVSAQSVLGEGSVFEFTI